MTEEADCPSPSCLLTELLWEGTAKRAHTLQGKGAEVGRLGSAEDWLHHASQIVGPDHILQSVLG